jgi:hypothetical protein
MSTTKLSTAEIDALNYSDSVKAVRAAGFKGTWIVTAKVATLKSLLKGEITEADARGSAAPVAAPAGASFAALEDTIQRAATAAAETVVEPLAARLAELEERPVAATAGTGSSDETDAAIEALGNSFTGAVTEVAAFRGELDDATKTLADIQSKVEAALASGGKAAARALAPVFAAKASTSGDPVTAVLEQFAMPGNCLKPILVKGDAGAGKTYAARAWNYDAGFDCYIEYGVHASTEPSDLLGSPHISAPWIDGPLSAAFRQAALGKSVLLVLDEIFRAQAQSRTVLLTCTSPATTPSGEKVYRLTTGRPIIDPETGVHQYEVLEAPCRNIAFVATTNVGAQFNVDMGCPAERDRFIAVHVKVEESKIRAVLGSIASARGFCPSIVDKVVNFWKGACALKADNFLELAPSTRILAEALEYTPTDAALRNTISTLGMHTWVGTTIDGEPEMEQIKRLNALMDSTLGK